MRKINFLIIGVILAVAIVIGITSTGFITLGEEKEEYIDIGFIGPLTGPGSALGINEKNALELSVKKINDKGGINGKNIRVFYEDGRGDLKTAVDSFNKLSNLNNIDIFLTVYSSETLAVGKLVNPKEKIVITAYAANPDISNLGEYVFRHNYSDKTTGRLISKDLLNFERIGILSEKTDYAIGLERVILKNLLDREVFLESFNVNEVDFKTSILKLLDNNVDAIFLNPDTPNTGILALRQLREFGFKGEVYTNYVRTISDFSNNPIAKGVIYYGDPEINNERVLNFLKEYEFEFKTEPYILLEAINRYDSSMFLFEAIKNVGTNTTDIKDYLLENEFLGLLGVIRYDENGDLIGLKPEKFVIE